MLYFTPMTNFTILFKWQILQGRTIQKEEDDNVKNR